MIGSTTLRLVGQRSPVHAGPIVHGPVLQLGDDMMEEIVDDEPSDEPLDDLDVLTPPPVKSTAPSMIAREMLPNRSALPKVAPLPAAQAAAVLNPDAPPAERLFAMAEALPDRPFGQGEIALINARGGIAHAAGSTPKVQSDGTDAVTLLRLLLLVCFRTRASDIHIEPKNDLFLLRVRIDGGLVDAAKLKKEMGVKLCAVIKILADIDIAQRNSVQEGQFGSRVPDRGGRLPRQLHALALRSEVRHPRIRYSQRATLSVGPQSPRLDVPIHRQSDPRRRRHGARLRPDRQRKDWLAVRVAAKH